MDEDKKISDYLATSTIYIEKSDIKGKIPRIEAPGFDGDKIELDLEDKVKYLKISKGEIEVGFIPDKLHGLIIIKAKKFTTGDMQNLSEKQKMIKKLLEEGNANKIDYETIVKLDEKLEEISVLRKRINTLYIS